MLATKLSMSSIVRVGGLSLFAVVALSAAQHSTAKAGTPEPLSMQQSETGAYTDVGVVRRHRQMRHTSPREAYGAYVDETAGGAMQSYSGYGYGVGDNSRDQTW